MIKYSIIIPIYNSNKTIANCINSILAATKNRNDVEILLINDGSNDNSEKICFEYASKNEYIKYFAKMNEGVSTARNFGVDKSNGKYILFVDSDDSISSDFLEKIDNILDENDYDYIVFNKIFNKNNKTINKTRNGLKIAKDRDRTIYIVSRLIVNKTINSPYAKVYKKSIIKENDIRFIENINIAEDWNFNIIYSLNVKSIYVSGDYVYNVSLDNDNSLSRTKFSEEKREQIEIATRNTREAVSDSKLSDDNRKTITSTLNFEKISNVYSQAKIDYRNGLSRKQRIINTKNRCKEIKKEKIIIPKYMYCWLIALPVKLRMCTFINLFAEYLVNR